MAAIGPGDVFEQFGSGSSSSNGGDYSSNGSTTSSDQSSPSSSAESAGFVAPSWHTFEGVHSFQQSPGHSINDMSQSSTLMWPRVAGLDDDLIPGSSLHEHTDAASELASVTLDAHPQHHLHALHNDEDMRLTGDFWSTAPSTAAPSPAASYKMSNGSVAQFMSPAHMQMDLDHDHLTESRACGPSSMGSPEPTLSFAPSLTSITGPPMPRSSFEMSQPADLNAVNAGISPHLTSSRHPSPPSTFEQGRGNHRVDTQTDTNHRIEQNLVKQEADGDAMQETTEAREQPAERRSTRDKSRTNSRVHSRAASLSRAAGSLSRSKATPAPPSASSSFPGLSPAELLQATIIGASTNLVTKDAVVVSKVLSKCSKPDRAIASNDKAGLELMVLGVPRFGAKSRVETQIKITLALVRPRQQAIGKGECERFVAFDGSLDEQANDMYERVASWSHLKLPAAQALKKKSKKQAKPGELLCQPAPEDTLVLDVAVVRASEDANQIYICDGCQQRERKRAQRKKDSSLAKQQQQQQSQSQPQPEVIETPLSSDEERQKVVVFNCAEFVELSGGEIVLPTRITCYCRHHKEKKGFMVRFAVRDHHGNIVASGSTPPVMITDDHKTKDTRPLQIVKQDDDTPVVAPMAAAPKAKKTKSGKAKKAKTAAAAASQRSKRSVSGRGPAEDEDQQQQDEDELASTAPVSGTSTPASIARGSGAAKKAKPYDADARPRKRPSGSHRSPGFAMTPLVGPSPSMRTIELAPTPNSLAPSPAAEPISQVAPMRSAVSPQMYAQELHSQASTALGLGGLHDQVMADEQAIRRSISTATSPATGGFDWRSSASTPPISPRSSGGTSVSTSNELHSMFDACQSPMRPAVSLPNSTGMHTQQQLAHMNALTSTAAAQAAMLSTLDWTSPAELQQLQQQQQHQQQHMPQQLQRPQPRISRLIPGEGPTHGGIEVTVLGEHFVPDLVCMFGDSPAVPTHYWSSTTLVCVLPPSANPGPVVVGIKGVRLSIDTGTEGLQLFTYRDDSDRGLLELALQVVGLKMTGRLEDASAVAMRIVGNNGNQGSSVAASSRSSQSPSAPIMTYRESMNLMQLAASSVQTTPTSSRPGSRTHSRRSSLANGDAESSPLPYTLVEGETRNFESILIKFLSLLDLDASMIPGASPSLPSTSPPISHVNAQKHNLLHLATVLGFHRLAQFLLARGIDFDAADRNGFTPLHFAALYGRVAIARLLLDAGADFDRVTVAGRSAEDIARIRDDVDVEQVLLRARGRRGMSGSSQIVFQGARSSTLVAGRPEQTAKFSPTSVSTELDSDTVSNEFDSDRFANSSDEVASDEVPDSQEYDSNEEESDWDSEEESRRESWTDEGARIEELDLSSDEEEDSDDASDETSDEYDSEDDGDSADEETAVPDFDRRVSRNASMVSLHYLLEAEAEQQAWSQQASVPSWAVGDSKDLVTTSEQELSSQWHSARPELKYRHSTQNKAELDGKTFTDTKRSTDTQTLNACEKAARFAIPIQMPELTTFQMMASNVVPAALSKTWRGRATSTSEAGETEGQSSGPEVDSDETARPSRNNRTGSFGASSTDDGGDKSPSPRDWRNLYGAGPWLRGHALPPSSPPPMYSPTDHLLSVNASDEKTELPWSEPASVESASAPQASPQSSIEESASTSMAVFPPHAPSTARTRRSHRSSEDRAPRVKHGLHNDRMLWLFWIPVLLIGLSAALYAHHDLLRNGFDFVMRQPTVVKLLR
ncbi:SPT3 Dosage dependent suppressor of Ty-induced promoter mutations-like protein [Microbotryomycetes sp. JL221]|nr:SPT3 Dosage dependent suppressor of Ty-induced promoter mutations-like protein [Microbotryomycetes sp. JL221]